MREMKDSGIEWIGEIPKNWKTCRLKDYAHICNGRDYSEVFDENGDYPVIGSGGQFAKACEPLYQKESVLLGRKGTIDKPLFVDHPFWTVDTMYYTEIKENISAKYFYYLCTQIEFDFYQYGSAVPSMTQRDLYNVNFPYPTLDEQRRIADYLDQKCSKIDVIIDRQQEVIEKLKNYKLSIITEAVTKGLNPDVPMKDSGVEWIGKIPEHWRLIRLKNIVKISDGTHDTPAYVDISETSHPLVTSKCIVDGKIDPSLGNHISQDDYDEINKRSKVHLYDVIMPMIGTVGNPALVSEEPNFAIKNVALLKTMGSLELGKFVLYLLSSNLAAVQFDKMNQGGVQSFISQEKLKNMIFTLPDSMAEIVVFLDKKIAVIDKVVKQKQMIIDKLINYKKSFIYEMVTGKKEV